LGIKIGDIGRMEQWNAGEKSKSKLYCFKPSIPVFQYSYSIIP
jgi:hypothetical protein